jgi:hypothetical protein
MPELPGDPPAGSDVGVSGEDPWDELAGGNPAVPNLFSAEIENVDASDWDFDTDLIWGDDGGNAVVDDGGIADPDFPL